MSPFDDDRVDPYEIVDRFWPYDGPYSDELTSSAAVMIGRLGRYLNNATQKRDGLPYAAVVGRVLTDVHGALAGYEQLFAQLARFVEREAESNRSLYDDRYDRPGRETARELVAELAAAAIEAGRYTRGLAPAVALASHLGSDS